MKGDEDLQGHEPKNLSIALIDTDKISVEFWPNPAYWDFGWMKVDDVFSLSIGPFEVSVYVGT